MAVLIPKGTNYPTVEPYSRDFYTSGAGQRRLEVPIYEGHHELAQQNELCGYVTVPLPNEVPANTSVRVSLGLAADRTITVVVRIQVASAESKVVQLQRFGRLDPVHQQRVEAFRVKLTETLDRRAQELTSAELAAFYRTLDELDEVLIGGPGSRPVDALLAQAEALKQSAESVRGEQAYVSAVIAAAGRYLSPDDVELLTRYREELKAVRERADWTAALVICENISAAIKALGEGVRIIVLCRTFANQGSLSPALTHRVHGALRLLDAGLDAEDSTAAENALTLLMEIWPEVSKEIGSIDFGPRGPIRLKDRI